MKLYLVQHAKATTEQQDPQRPLTEEAKRDMAKVAGFIRPLDLSVDALWHSGKRRAEQTAELLAQAVKIETGPTARDGLAPNDDVTVLRDELAASRHDIMIVGHMPSLSRLASLLLTGTESADTVAFKNGGVVCLQRNERNRWQIDWIVTPEILR